jgi:predicted nucleic acid-binding protein
MIVLDTNIISEMMRPAPVASVKAWIDSQPEASFFTTAVCEAEILYGLAILPDGRRKSDLIEYAEAVFAEDLADRVLPFDRAAARAYATIASAIRGAGHGFDTSDIQIAAIARVHGFAVATRNVRHFAGCGIELINPFAP